MMRKAEGARDQALSRDGKRSAGHASQVLGFRGLERQAVDQAGRGTSCRVAGLRGAPSGTRSLQIAGSARPAPAAQVDPPT